MEDFQKDIDKCLEVLQAGGLILYPTDTVWGIGCDATNEAAVAKIYKLKQREDSKKMIVLMTSEREVMQYVTQLDLSIFDYLETVSKPTTVIYEGVIGLAENILGEDGSVAIRMCEEPFCKHLIKRFQKPIVSTSANISGNPTPSFYADIQKEILDGVDYVVRYRQDDNSPKEPSAVIKWDKSGNMVVIRA
jgi:L-threonylcarbamoyladenylate synthase